MRTLSIGLILAMCTVAQADEKPTRPNIILIMADDMGYECMPANGGAPYKTPYLDKLAAGGCALQIVTANRSAHPRACRS